MSDRRVIGFAHRGMPGRAPDNSVAGYRLALAAGATALEGDVWTSVDGQAVLDHDGVVKVGRRSRPVPETTRAAMPGLSSLSDLYEACGSDFELSLDVKQVEALEPTLRAARAAGASDRLWLCHPDWALVATWKPVAPEVNLVDSTRLKRISEGPEERLRRLSEAGIAALNMPHVDWSAELVALCRGAGIRALAWHAHTRPTLEAMVALGVDGVFSDDVEAMVAVLAGH